MDKQDYRKAALSRRDEISAADRECYSSRITEKLLESKELRDADNILVYCSYLSEVDTHCLIEKLIDLGKKVYCPKVTDPKEGKMEFYQVRDMRDLAKGYHGIPEPVTKDIYVTGVDSICTKTDNPKDDITKSINTKIINTENINTENISTEPDNTKNIITESDNTKSINTEPDNTDGLHADTLHKNTLMILPGVAFDRECNRIGYRGGFYDRYIPRIPGAYLIAIAFEEQISEDIFPMESHDIKPDAVYTQTRIIRQKPEKL